MIDNTITTDSEEALIGALIKDNDLYDNLEGLKPEAFYNHANKVIYKTLCSMIENGKQADIILLAEELNKQGNLESVGELSYIGSLVLSACAPGNIKNHSKNITKAWKLRSLKTLIAELEAMTESRADLDQILETAETGLFNLLEDKDDSKLCHIKEAVIEAIEWEDKDQSTIKTGLRDLDRLTDGFGKSNLIIVAGRPSQGKSALAMQIAEQVANRESVVIFSLEMSKREVAQRMLNFHSARIGKSQAVSHLYDLQLHVDDKPAATLGHIRSQCRKIKRKHGLSMIVVDYLQLMQGVGDNRTQEIGSITRGLKNLAKEFDIPVVLLSQLSRKLEERSDKRPIMSDLRDSGEIEQDADLILFIYRDETYNDQSDFKGLGEVIARKNRNGATGDITLTFEGSTTRFGDYNGQPILRIVKKQERGFTL